MRCICVISIIVTFFVVPSMVIDYFSNNSFLINFLRNESVSLMFSMFSIYVALLTAFVSILDNIHQRISTLQKKSVSFKNTFLELKKELFFQFFVLIFHFLLLVAMPKNVDGNLYYIFLFLLSFTFFIYIYMLFEITRVFFIAKEKEENFSSKNED